MEGHGRVEAIRLRRGLTVIDLAAKTGLARQTIYSVERDPGHKPSIGVMAKIARALNVTVDELLEPERVA